MSTKERAAAYLIILLMEESANKLGRKDTTLNNLVNVPGMKRVPDKDKLRPFRNAIAHNPLNYGECYRLLSKYKQGIVKGLLVCSEFIDISNEQEICSSIDMLLRFYKENK